MSCFQCPSSSPSRCSSRSFSTAASGGSRYGQSSNLPSCFGGSRRDRSCSGDSSSRRRLINSCWPQFGIEGPSWICHPTIRSRTLVVLSVWAVRSPMIIFLAGHFGRSRRTCTRRRASTGHPNSVSFYKITLPLLTPGGLLQRGRADDRRLQGLHSRLHHSGRAPAGPINSTLF